MKKENLNLFHWLLAVQSLVGILVSINRLGSFTLGYVAENEFLRWMDLHNMLVLPIISLVGFYLLKKHIEYDGPMLNSRQHLLVNLLFVVGVYVLGASYGDHETTNYLHTRFCKPISNETLCRIIIFNDDQFGHWLFFAGFVLMNGALLAVQLLFPYRGEMSGRDVVLLMTNAVFIGVGVFANLAFEVIGLDLYVVGLLTVINGWAFRRYGQQPLVIYYLTAYAFGLLATGMYKMVN